MGDNYFTEVSDVITDAFDVLLGQAKTESQIKLIKALKKHTDSTFRTDYSTAKDSLKLK